MTTRELLAAKAAAKGKAEAILNSVSSAGTKMSAEQTTEFDACVAEVARIDTLVAQQAIVAGWNNTTVKPAVNNERTEHSGVAASAEYAKAFYAYARRGATTAPEFLAALSTGTDSAGYLVPVTLDAAIVQKAALQSAMRRLSRVITTTNDRNFAVEGTLATAAWTAEAAPVTETSPTFDRVTLKAYKMSSVAKIDNELLYDSQFPLDAELASQFGRAFGILEEAAFIHGSGDGQPTGCATTAPVGVHASYGVITADNVLDLYHALNPAYRQTATWVLNDSTALALRKLKFQIGSDTVSYIWQPGLAAGDPDRLVGRPVAYSAQMQTIAAGTPSLGDSVSLLFGDFAEAYAICDRTPRTFQRLVELYAGNDQTGFKVTQRTDGNIVKPEAVTCLRHDQ